MATPGPLGSNHNAAAVSTGLYYVFSDLLCKEGKGDRLFPSQSVMIVVLLKLWKMLENGSVNQSVVKQRPEEAGISTTTMNRAKQRCGRNSKRISKGLTVWL
jgi:CRISPR/Cas system endoribonuclease Cas6 (RAMP superfamily)